MPHFALLLLHALIMAAGMFWQVGWSLVLGFALSAFLQEVVSRQTILAALGGDGPRAIAIATLAGAASSSCSYAAAAVTRTLFQKGAGLAPSLAFLLASTNLVIELGLVLYLLMGWQFAAGEWAGGVVMVVLMTGLVRLTYPAALVQAARHHGMAGTAHQSAAGTAHQSAAHQHDAPSSAPSGTMWARVARRETWLRMSRYFVMDWAMLWKDLLLGFLIAGALSVFVPAQAWQTLFVQNAAPWLRTICDALLGPLVAALSFVCSIGNVPMAAVLWGSGVSFGGVLAFLFADLIVLPLLDTYRRAFGWKMAAYIGGIFYVTMVLAALIMQLAFSVLGLSPPPPTHPLAASPVFALNATFWLNLAFGGLALWLFSLARRGAAASPADNTHACAHHNH